MKIRLCKNILANLYNAIHAINQYPFIVWYDTSNNPADNNIFGIYITY